MRHPLVPALVVFLLLAAFAAGGAVLAAAGPGDRVAVEGTVTGAGAPAGDAVVLVGEYALLTKLSPDELRDLAADDPQDLTVVDVADDGTFATTVPNDRADAAVALSDTGISRTVRLGNENTTLDLTLHDHRSQTVHVAVASASRGDTETRMYVSLVNNGDAPVQNLSVALDALPNGWSVAAVETDGTYDPATRTLSWDSVAPGAEVDTTVTLAVPADVAVGEYAVELSAASDTHPATVDGGTVEVRPEETAGPTVTSQPAGDESPAPTTEPPVTEQPRTPTAPGFGAAAAVGALVLLALTAWRRA